ncbi:flagellar motor protein MotB [Desnuesiella massiliensis]|uniref:flagellar motor protein MotB n=1 Tax=Desnuesiella massiliensis TaxID=1650662 RepID=UPI0006E26CB7|nr:flagellar motor protein MotB [Desnuesiella massiliensis]
MKKREEKEANHERWLLTYSDLITLLMIFFVIMYASSNVSASKYKAVSDSFKIALGGGGGSLVGPVDSVNANGSNERNDNKEVSEENKLMNLKENVDNYLQSAGMSTGISTSIEERGLVISLKDSIIFDSGKAEIKNDYKKKLVDLGSILNKMDSYIRVEGHTDNVPINNNKFNSNWQLSVIRATNVTELLIEEAHIAPKRLSSIGYGEFRPVADNNTEQGRAQNRRVDIVLINSKYNEIENNKK